ncbi:MAG: hypothetical protein KBD16_03455 [Candidatus Pacebacteria bacterium]|nr:hypothetical protein [Candidatus Paceibacterota bacterium]
MKCPDRHPLLDLFIFSVYNTPQKVRERSLTEFSTRSLYRETQVINQMKEEYGVPKFVSVLVMLVLGLVVLGLVAFGIFYVGWVDFVDNYQAGYSYDVRTGKVEVLAKRGWIITPPILVKVHTIDLRPMQVCINANARVLNCKLVQFDSAGLELFVSWHGRDDYEGPGTSATAGAGGLSTPLAEILKSYAYEGSKKTYPFLKIIRELKPEEAQLEKIQ